MLGISLENWKVVKIKRYDISAAQKQNIDPYPRCFADHRGVVAGGVTLAGLGGTSVGKGIEGTQFLF